MAFKMELGNFQKCDSCGKEDAYDVIILTHSSKQRTNQIIIHISCIKRGIGRLIKKAGDRITKTPTP